MWVMGNEKTPRVTTAMYSEKEGLEEIRGRAISTKTRGSLEGRTFDKAY